ncbi:MAG: hypothetical protein MJZ92_03305 [Paludibacteraceae bacterium]|nr:hypothetical protein [Paludibacteraceae bacterium]
MKRLLLLPIVLLCGMVSAEESYPRNERKIVLDRVYNCSPERTKEVIDKFVYQLQAEADSLFTWAYMNTSGGGDTKGKDAVQLRYKKSEYYPETHNSLFVTDIVVLGVPWKRNVEIGGHYWEKIMANNSRYSQLDITYSGKILQDAKGLFLTTPRPDGKTNVHFELHVLFGKFFSAFITKKTWQEVAVWRFETIMNNLKEYAETGTVLPKTQN